MQIVIIKFQYGLNFCSLDLYISLWENFNVFDFSLSKEDMDEIKTLDTGDSLFFNNQDPKMEEWFDQIVMVRRGNQDSSKEKKNW